MIRRDMPGVLEIERASTSRPWDEQIFLCCLRQTYCIGMVAEKGEKVVGFMLYDLNKTSIEVTNFAVHPDYRLAEVGTQMVLKLKSKLSAHRRTRITSVVRETNLGAQLFAQKMGFLATSVIRSHFGDSGEDGYRMEFDLVETQL
jgi:ribosomal-protein-alanine N-acetyltransferase